jgi:hypothetical protein
MRKNCIFNKEYLSLKNLYIYPLSYNLWSRYGSKFGHAGGKITVIDAIRFVTYATLKLQEIQSEYLLFLISESEIDRPRRNRVNPPVVKIKMSKFKRKNSTHKSEIRDLNKDLEILLPKAV